MNALFSDADTLSQVDSWPKAVVLCVFIIVIAWAFIALVRSF